GVHLNPFDLGGEPDALTRRGLFLHSFVSVLVGGEPDPACRAALDRAIIAAYASRGITTDPRTFLRPAPQLGDLAAALAGDSDPGARSLGDRLTPYVSGTHR